MKTAAIYVRVSTDKQNTDTQLLAIRDYAKRRDVQIIAEYVDAGQSGGKKNRPALDQLMRDAKLCRFDAVIVARFDRFARSVTQLMEALETFQILGIDFISLGESIDTTTPIGRMVFTFIGAIAEFEKSIIRERIMSGLDRARAEGKHLGRPKRICDREKVARLRAEGKSARLIAKLLKLSDRTVRRLIYPAAKTPPRFLPQQDGTAGLTASGD